MMIRSTDTSINSTPINISPADVSTLIEAGAALIDVREHQETSAGHAPGATVMPLQSFNPQMLPTDRPLIFICRSGARSMAVANAVAQMGFTTYNVVGGMGSWAAAGLPVVTEAGTPGRVL